MSYNAAIAAVLGTIGTILWCIQLIPQIIVNYVRHSTQGLQPLMLLLWSIGAVIMGIYNISRNLNIPLQLQPQLFLLLCFITWGQCLYYEKKWSIYKCITVFSSGGCISGFIEAGFVFLARLFIRRNIEWPIITIGVISSIFICIGLFPPYYDIYIHKCVRGISFIFLLIDMGGALFSFLSLLFEPKFDILAAISYSSVFFLEIGIIMFDYYFKLLEWNKKRKLNKKEKEEVSEKTMDIIDVNIETS
ncbi:hypothetical protein T552_02021 [Pneumocystis carinii B80]|uniref:PQ loop repeat protein n=1 Tax=Pneumocystis carinii (strain B80) TaxID=1408658 RepID=A0A0W4ZIG2_PNEC8|nr:hypothetical protein T552_02021 [Pneumocystis carinii B80]KTW28162.1 hypothetical protein T552_02021 [Pneumocystis carinii B80]